MKLALLSIFLALPLLAQNPKPCSNVTNTAAPGQILSATSAGSTPPCRWIAAGGGGSGSVTSITAANGLTATPNPIVTTGTISGINAAADGATRGVAAFTAADFNAATGVISIDYANGQKASATLPGFLSSADWSTFNGKGSGSVTSVGLAGTTNQITVTGATPITGSGSWTLSLPATLVLPSGTTGTSQSQGDNSTKIATTAYTDLAVANGIAGVNPAVAVAAASTANVTGTYANGASGVGATFTVTATGAFTLDGVAISTIGQRVLLKNQSTGFQNGVYTATVVGALGISPIFTRALDYNQPSDINSTGAIPVQAGTVNTTTSWLLTSTVTTVGTDALTYVQFSLAPSTLVTASSPGVGIAHFAGSTQAVTSSAVNLAGGTNEITGNLPVANLNSGTSASSSTFWRGDGTWAAAGGAPSTVILAPVAIASITAAGTAGRYYPAFTDSAYHARDNGASWDYYFPGAAGTITKPPAVAGYTLVDSRGDATFSNAQGGMFINCPGNATGLIRFGYQTATYPSTSFTFTVGMNFNIPGQNYGFTGIAISDGTKYMTFGPATDSDRVTAPGVEVVSWTNAATLAGLVGSAAFYYKSPGPLIYLTMQDDLSANLTFWISDDINNLQAIRILQTSRTATLTPSRVGVFCNTYVANMASQETIYHMAGTGGFTP